MEDGKRLIKVLEFDTSRAMQKVEQGRTTEIDDRDFDWSETVLTYDELIRRMQDENTPEKTE